MTCHRCRINKLFLSATCLGVALSAAVADAVTQRSDLDLVLLSASPVSWTLDDNSHIGTGGLASLNNEGNLVFNGDVTISNGGPSGYGAWLYRDGDMRMLAPNGAPISLFGGGTFETYQFGGALFGYPPSNEGDDALLSSNAPQGILQWTPGGVRKIVASGDPLPGFDADWQFSYSYGIRHNPKGQTLFVGTMLNPSTRDVRSGLWFVAKGAAPELVLADGETLPGLQVGEKVAYLYPDEIAMNNDGSYIFAPYITNALGQPIGSGNIGSAIWRRKQNSPLEMVMRSGEHVLAAGRMQRLDLLNVAAPAMNNLDEVLYIANLTPAGGGT